MLGAASQGLKKLGEVFPPSIPPAFSLSLISSLEISLRRLSAGKLVTSVGLRQQPPPPPALTTGR